MHCLTYFIYITQNDGLNIVSAIYSFNQCLAHAIILVNHNNGKNIVQLGFIGIILQGK